MTFRVQYISLEGHLVSTTVEADDEEAAVAKAWEQDAEFSSGDNIHMIVGVE